jgi:hypothetical protein
MAVTYLKSPVTLVHQSQAQEPETSETPP